MRSSFFVSFALIASLVVVGTNAQASKYALIIEDDFKAGKEGTYESTNIDTKNPVVIFKLGQEDPLPLYKIVHLPDTDFNGLSTYVTYEFAGKALFLVHSLDTFMTVNILKNDEQIHIDVEKQVDIDEVDEASSSTKDVRNSYRFLLSQKMYVCRPNTKVEIQDLNPLIECFVEGSDAVVASLNKVWPKVIDDTGYLIEIKQPENFTEDEKNTLVQLLPLFKLRPKSESKPKENPVASVPSSSRTDAQFIRNDVTTTYLRRVEKLGSQLRRMRKSLMALLNAPSDFFKSAKNL